MIDSRAALETLLSSGVFDGLVGTVENVWFDAKDQPYDVTTDRGKRDLAKDVSAFANVVGGTVVIGARTKPSTTHFGDEVTELRPFEQSLVDPGQYRKIIADWVYPIVEGPKSHGFQVHPIRHEGWWRFAFLSSVQRSSLSSS
jgi:hypothetical protein